MSKKYNDIEIYCDFDTENIKFMSDGKKIGELTSYQLQTWFENDDYISMKEIIEAM